MRTFRVIAVLAVITLTVSPVAASTAGSIVISELASGMADNASKEFIELYNPGTTAISVTGWSVEYKSATSSDTATSWSKRAGLTGAISAHGFYLVAPLALYSLADADWSATMASGGGNIRLKNDKGEVIDQVAYGSGNAPEGAAAVAPAAGQSIERLPGRVNETAGNAVDTNNNAGDFVLRPAAQPQSSTSAAEPSVEGSIPSEIQQITEDTSLPQFGLILITELFINPMAPLTDAHDEYIELHNPTNTAIDITGYQLQSGTTFQNSYTFTATTIPPQSYKAFTIVQTKLTLSNTAGKVRLVDPSGAMIDQTDGYTDAPDGQSWSLFSEGWQWTLQPTPDKANSAVFPVIPVVAVTATQPPLAAVKATAKKAAAKPTAKKAATTKKATVKAVKVKAAVKPKASTVAQVSAAQVKTASWLLIGLIILTIGYAVYEFRHDLRNYYRLIRRYRISRSKNRIAPEGRRDD